MTRENLDVYIKRYSNNIKSDIKYPEDQFIQLIILTFIIKTIENNKQAN